MLHRLETSTHLQVNLIRQDLVLARVYAMSALSLVQVILSELTTSFQSKPSRLSELYAATVGLSNGQCEMVYQKKCLCVQIV